MLGISRLQIRNAQLNEEVTNLKRESAANIVGDSGKLCNDELWKLEQKIDHISYEKVRLQASNEAISAKIINFLDKTKMLHTDANTKHYRVLNLEAGSHI